MPRFPEDEEKREIYRYDEEAGKSHLREKQRERQSLRI